MRLPRSALLRYLLAAALASIALTGASAESTTHPDYLPPRVRGGLAFPVARSNWFSVINFENDWHAPRLRMIDGTWQLVGRHEGTDVYAEPGTPVLAVAPGRVEAVGWTFLSGWRVGIRSDDGRYWFYAHLNSYAPAATVGRRVAAGTMLGTVGNTGYGARPGHRDEFTYHLHFGIQEPDGTWTNPHPLLRRLYREAVASSP